MPAFWRSAPFSASAASATSVFFAVSFSFSAFDTLWTELAVCCILLCASLAVCDASRHTLELYESVWQEM